MPTTTIHIDLPLLYSNFAIANFDQRQLKTKKIELTLYGRRPQGSMSGPCHVYRGLERGEAWFEVTCLRLHLRPVEYSQPRTMGEVVTS